MSMAKEYEFKRLKRIHYKLTKFPSALFNSTRMSILKRLSIQDASFKELKDLFGLTDGNLASHMRALEKIGYISARKTFENKRPKTIYTITKIRFYLKFCDLIDDM